jgi:predicted RNA-binding protein YlxR (DUF448 family)
MATHHTCVWSWFESAALGRRRSRMTLSRFSAHADKTQAVISIPTRRNGRTLWFVNFNDLLSAGQHHRAVQRICLGSSQCERRLASTTRGRDTRWTCDQTERVEFHKCRIYICDSASSASGATKDMLDGMTSMCRCDVLLLIGGGRTSRAPRSWFFWAGVTGYSEKTESVFGTWCVMFWRQNSKGG